jgi:hypothetical protein
VRVVGDEARLLLELVHRPSRLTVERTGGAQRPSEAPILRSGTVA